MSKYVKITIAIVVVLIVAAVLYFKFFKKPYIQRVDWITGDLVFVDKSGKVFNVNVSHNQNVKIGDYIIFTNYDAQTDLIKSVHIQGPSGEIFNELFR